MGAVSCRFGSNERMHECDVSDVMWVSAILARRSLDEVGHLGNGALLEREGWEDFALPSIHSMPLMYRIDTSLGRDALERTEQHVKRQQPICLSDSCRQESSALLARFVDLLASIFAQPLCTPVVFFIPPLLSSPLLSMTYIPPSLSRPSPNPTSFAISLTRVAPSRRQPPRVPREQRRLPDVVQPEEILHDAVQAQPAAAVRAAAPAERVGVVAEALVLGP